MYSVSSPLAVPKSFCGINLRGGFQWYRVIPFCNCCLYGRMEEVARCLTSLHHESFGARVQLRVARNRWNLPHRLFNKGGQCFLVLKLPACCRRRRYCISTGRGTITFNCQLEILLRLLMTFEFVTSAGLTNAGPCSEKCMGPYTQRTKSKETMRQQQTNELNEKL